MLAPVAFAAWRSRRLGTGIAMAKENARRAAVRGRQDALDAYRLSGADRVALRAEANRICRCERLVSQRIHRFRLPLGCREELL